MKRTLLKKIFTLNHIFLVSGFVLFIYLCHSLGFRKIADLIISFHFRFLLIFGLCLFWHGVNTLSWWLVIPPHKNIPFFKAYFVKMYSDALNILLPLFNFGGEGYRLAYLKKYFSSKTSFNGIFMDRALHFGSGFIFAALGWYFLGDEVPLFAEKKEWVIGAGIFFMVLTVVLGWGPVLSKKYNAKEFFHHRNPLLDDSGTAPIALWKLPLALCCRLLGWFLGSVEIYYILNSLGYPVAYPMAYFIASFLVFLGLLSLLVPTNWGIVEASLALLFAKMGLLPSLGLSMALIRRIRLLMFSITGLMIGAFLQRGKKQLNSTLCSGQNSPDFKKNIIQSSSSLQ